MPATNDNIQNANEAPAVDENVSADTFVMGHLSRMADGLVADGTSPDAIYRKLFATISEHYRPLVAKIDVQDAGIQIKDSYESPKLSGTSLIEVGSIAVAETLTEALCEQAPVFRINSLDAKKKYVTIAVPIRDALQSNTVGAVAVALVPRTQSDINALVAELNSLVLAAAGFMTSAPADPSDGQSNTDWARVLTRVAKMGNSHEFAFTLVNTLADRFECGKVALGLVSKQRVRVRAISGLASFKDNSPGVSDMQQAMEECFDVRRIVSSSREDVEAQRPLPIHRVWAEKTNSSVASLPIQLDDETLGIVTLTRAVDRPFTEADLESLDKMLQPFGPPLKMIEKSGRTIIEHVRDDGYAAITPWIRPKSIARKVAMGVMGLAMLWFLFGSLTYKPVCESVLSPASLNHMAAPFPTRIAAVHVESGESVTRGQVLVTLDSRELQLERKQLIAKIKSAQVGVGQALSERDAPAAALAKAEVGVLQSQLLSTENKINQCTLRAPGNGFVVKANLKKRIGQALAQGEPLLTFAPGDNWIVEVHVPDSVSPYVASEQTGVFRSYSHPDESFEFQLQTVSGSAEVIEGKNVFVAEAALANQALWMKSGMKGVARISGMKKPVWWVTLHGALDYLQMKFWL